MHSSPLVFQILRNVTQRRLLPEVLYSLGRKNMQASSFEDMRGTEKLGHIQ